MWQLIIIIALWQLGWLVPVIAFGAISIAITWVFVELVRAFDW
jgi:hypothetical protein